MREAHDAPTGRNFGKAADLRHTARCVLDGSVRRQGLRQLLRVVYREQSHCWQSVAFMNQTMNTARCNSVYECAVLAVVKVFKAW